MIENHSMRENGPVRETATVVADPTTTEESTTDGDSTTIGDHITSRLDADLTVGVYLRARPADVRARDAVLDALRRYLADDRIADLEVELWPRAISLTSVPASTPTVRTVRRFERWARENDVTLRPAFETNEVESTITGERDRVLHLPSTCLTLSRDDGLVGVFPCTSDGHTTTVPDVVEALEADREADGAAAVSLAAPGEPGRE